MFGFFFKEILNTRARLLPPANSRGAVGSRSEAVTCHQRDDAKEEVDDILVRGKKTVNMCHGQSLIGIDETSNRAPCWLKRWSAFHKSARTKRNSLAAARFLVSGSDTQPRDRSMFQQNYPGAAIVSRLICLRTHYHSRSVAMSVPKLVRQSWSRGASQIGADSRGVCSTAGDEGHGQTQAGGQPTEEEMTVHRVHREACEVRSTTGKPFWNHTTPHTLANVHNIYNQPKLVGQLEFNFVAAVVGKVFKSLLNYWWH